MDVFQREPPMADGIIAITARARRKETARSPQPVLDLSKAPAWIASPQLSGVVDLVRTETFPTDKKVRPRKRRWADDWRKLVIGASPYNRYVAPVRERPTITVQEAVARRMLKLRAKLGIAASDLLPASVDSEVEDPARTKKSASCEDVGVSDCASSCSTEVNIGLWKQEAEAMLDLLGPDTGHAHEYPMTELKRKVGSSSSTKPNQHQIPPASDSNQTGDHRMPEYRHSTPMPRPRPTAEVAALARAARRRRAERGVSTAADGRAELEERVSAYLSGIIAEEYCRDALPLARPAVDAGKGVSMEFAPSRDSVVHTGSPLATSEFDRSKSPTSSLRSRSRPRSKRQRGATTTVKDVTYENDRKNEMSRRRLAAFLERITPSACGRDGDDREDSPPRTPGDVAGNDVSTTACVPVGNVCARRAHGLGGEESTPAIPSREMTANFVGLLEEHLGLGVWNDPVASQLARPLDTILAYLPPEGAQMYRESRRQFQSSGDVESEMTADVGGGKRIRADKQGESTNQSKPAATKANGIDKNLDINVNNNNSGSNPAVKPQQSSAAPSQCYPSGCGLGFGVAGSHGEKAAVLVSNRARRAGGGDGIVAAKGGGVSLTSTMENGVVAEVPRAVWLGRVAAVMEARGDRDEAVRLYGQASAELTGQSDDGFDGNYARCSPISRGALGLSAGGRSMETGHIRGSIVGGGWAGAMEGAGGRDGVGSTGVAIFPYSARAHHLASCIERSYRRHFMRRIAAQTSVAAVFRGHLARADKRLERLRAAGAQCYIARCWRRFMKKRHRAAVMIQAILRGVLGRRQHAHVLLTILSAIKIQSLARVCLAKKRLRERRVEEAAAKLLQALQRGFALRSVRANAIGKIHSSAYRAALGLNRLSRGFLHRRFAGMVRQFVVDGEIERAEKEAVVVRGAVRLAIARADLYLTTDDGKSELAQQMRRARAAIARAIVARQHASSEDKQREEALEVFSSFDLDGSGTIDNSELKPLLDALGVRAKEAELKVAAAILDADGSGDIRFSEFYRWFNGENGGGGVDDATSKARDSRVSSLGPGGLHAEGRGVGSRPTMNGKAGLGSAVRSGFAKAWRGLRRATGVALRDRARGEVVRRWAVSASREAQVRFRETRPPLYECCRCRKSFALYGDYWRHFGGGSHTGADLMCRDRMAKGRLFSDPNALGRELKARAAVEHQWRRLLDERYRLEMAAIRSAAEEGARLDAKGSVGAAELADIADRIFTGHVRELKGGDNRPAREGEKPLRAAGLRLRVARLAVKAFDHDGNGTLDVSDLDDLLRMLRGVSAGITVGGVEGAMEAMDEDHSGQINLDEFMRWFAGFCDDEDGGKSSTRAGTQGTVRERQRQIYRLERKRSRSDGERYSKAGTAPGHRKTRGINKVGDVGGVVRSSIAGVPSGQSESQGKGGGKEGSGSDGEREKTRESDAADRREEEAKDLEVEEKDEEEEEEKEEGEDSAARSTMSWPNRLERRENKLTSRFAKTAAGGAHRNNKGGRSGGCGENGGTARLSFQAPRALSRAPGDSWKGCARTLRAVAKQEAKTLLLRRQRTRAQVNELARFRATRPPDYGWTVLSTKFLEKNHDAVLDVTAEADASFVETLYRSLRDAEDAVRTAGMPKATGATTTPTLMPPSPSPPVTPLDKAPPLNPPQRRRADRTRGVTGSKDKTANNIKAGSAATSASATAVSAQRSVLLSSLFGSRSLPWRWGKGRGQGTAKGSEGTSVSVTEAVKAAEIDAAAYRRRLLRTAHGRAGISRVVRQIQADIVTAKTTKVTTTTATTRGIVAKKHPEAAKGPSYRRQSSPSAGERSSAGETAAGMSAAVSGMPKAAFFESERKDVVDKALQLFDLFDADGSGSIDREELAPLLRELGVSLSPTEMQEIFPLLDLDASGDVGRDELAAWVATEGVELRRTVAARLLQAGQYVQALGNPTRRLEHQVRTSLICRARAIARAEAWASCFASSPEAAETATVSEATATLATPKTSATVTDYTASEGKVAAAAATATAAAVGARAPPIASGPQGTTTTKDESEELGPRRWWGTGRGQEEQKYGAMTEEERTRREMIAIRRGRRLAERAEHRRARSEEHLRAAERELLLRKAEDKAGRLVKRRWQTQAGKAELWREQDRVLGAEMALKVTLKSWDTDNRGSGASHATIRRRREEERICHVFRLFDTCCNGCIDAGELGRLMLRLHIRVSEAELASLIAKIDRTDSDCVNFPQFSAWWHDEGKARAKRPAAVFRATISAVARAVAPTAAARRDARRALMTGARSEARSQLKAALQIEDAKMAPARGTRSSPRSSASSSLLPLEAPRAAGAGDVVIRGRGDQPAVAARWLIAGRASKLARVEAEAYADVQAAIRTPAGKRELWRRAHALRLEWTHVAAAATAIAHRKTQSPPTPATVSATNGQAEMGGEENTRLPFLRFAWNTHAIGAAAIGVRSALEASGPEDRAGSDLEPSEMKFFLGANIVQLGLEETMRVGGTGEGSVLHSTLARSIATTNNGGVGGNDAPASHSEMELNGLKTLTRIPFRDLAASLSTNPTDGGFFGPTTVAPLRHDGQKVLPSPPSADPAAAVTKIATARTTKNNSGGWRQRLQQRTRPAKKAKIARFLADLAFISRLRIRMVLVPGAFRRLAEEALLAESRAFERHELARQFASEDGLPWRLAEEAVSKTGREFSELGWTTSDVDRLRATAPGVARLARALAQGEHLAEQECRSFLCTSAGLAEVEAARLGVRELRQRNAQTVLASATPAAIEAHRIGDGGGDGVGSDGRTSSGGKMLSTIRRAVSSFYDLGTDELRLAFALCEAENVPGEISGAEAAHVLEYAGIRQKTLATAGRVHLSAPGERPGRRPTARRRRDRSRPWVQRFIGRHRRRGGEGAQPKANKRHTATRTTIPTIEGHSDDPGALRRLRQLLTFRPHFKATDSDKRENTAVVCPTEDGTDEEVVERWDIEIREERQGRRDCARNVEEAGSVRTMSSRGHHECSDSGDGEVAAADASPDVASDDDDDDDSDGYSVDVGVVDDVTCDEGFELGEVEILLKAAELRQTPLERAYRTLRLLIRRALPTSLAERRDARALLMSRARTAGREKAMQAFETLLSVGTDNPGSTDSHHHNNDNRSRLIAVAAVEGGFNGLRRAAPGTTTSVSVTTISEEDDAAGEDMLGELP